VGMNTSLGYGNYNAGFISFRMSQWRGMTLQSNLTYGKALGTGSEVQSSSPLTLPDAYNIHSAYGLQPWDRKFVFNTFLVYQPSFFKGQHGLLGRIAGGWSFAPIVTLGSGLPLSVQPTDAFANETYAGGQSFGEGKATTSPRYKTLSRSARRTSAVPDITTQRLATHKMPVWSLAQTCTAPACSSTRTRHISVSGTRS